MSWKNNYKRKRIEQDDEKDEGIEENAAGGGGGGASSVATTQEKIYRPRKQHYSFMVKWAQHERIVSGIQYINLFLGLPFLLRDSAITQLERAAKIFNVYRMSNFKLRLINWQMHGEYMINENLIATPTNRPEYLNLFFLNGNDLHSPVIQLMDANTTHGLNMGGLKRTVNMPGIPKMGDIDGNEVLVEPRKTQLPIRDGTSIFGDLLDGADMTTVFENWEYLKFRGLHNMLDIRQCFSKYAQNLTDIPMYTTVVDDKGTETPINNKMNQGFDAYLRNRCMKVWNFLEQGDLEFTFKTPNYWMPLRAYGYPDGSSETPFPLPRIYNTESIPSTNCFGPHQVDYTTNKPDGTRAVYHIPTYENTHLPSLDMLNKYTTLPGDTGTPTTHAAVLIAMPRYYDSAGRLIQRVYNCVAEVTGEIELATLDDAMALRSDSPSNIDPYTNTGFNMSIPPVLRLTSNKGDGFGTYFFI